MTDKQLALLLCKYKYELDKAYDEMYKKMPQQLLEVDESGLAAAVKFTRPILDVIESLKCDIEDLGGTVF